MILEPGTIVPVILNANNVPKEMADKVEDQFIDALLDISDWYARETDTGGFRFGELQWVDVPASDCFLYSDNPLDYMVWRMQSRGYRNRWVGFVPYVYIGLGFGLGGYAGSVRWPRQAGLCMLGDAAIQALLGNTRAVLAMIGGSEARASRDGQTGAIAHEILHGLGWGPHDDEAGNQLSSFEYQYWPSVHLTLMQKAQHFGPGTKWSVFFAAKPLKGLAWIKRIINMYRMRGWW